MFTCTTVSIPLKTARSHMPTCASCLDRKQHLLCFCNQADCNSSLLERCLMQHARAFSKPPPSHSSHGEALQTWTQSNKQTNLMCNWTSSTPQGKTTGQLLTSSTCLMTSSVLLFAADKRHNAIGHDESCLGNCMSRNCTRFMQCCFTQDMSACHNILQHGSKSD